MATSPRRYLLNLGVRQENEKQVLPRLMLENQETSRALVVVQDHRQYIPIEFTSQGGKIRGTQEMSPGSIYKRKKNTRSQKEAVIRV